VTAAIVLTALLVVLAVFQLALALGAPLGHFAWGGTHRVLPPKLRIGSLVSIVIYALIVVIALDRSRVIDVVPDPVSTVGMWVVFGYFVLGIPLNAVSRSRPERFTMTPVVLVLAVLSLLVALG
jgi:hypothetical protein